MNYGTSTRRRAKTNRAAVTTVALAVFMASVAPTAVVAQDFGVDRSTSAWLVRSLGRDATGLASPVAIAYDPATDSLLVADGNGRATNTITIERLDRTTGDRQAPVTVEPWSSDFSLAVDGVTGAVAVVDHAASLPESPTSAAFDSRSGSLLTIDETSGTVLVVDSDGTTTQTSIVVDGGTAIAVDPEGEVHVAVDNGSDTDIAQYDASGKLTATYDLSALGIGTIQSMTFAPSGDPTDDAETFNLYAVSSTDGGATVAEISLTALVVTAAVPVTGTLLATTQTWQWSPSSPDPAGIVQLLNGNLLVSDSEVNEMSIFTGTNLFETTVEGVLSNTGTTIGVTNEPTGLGLNPANNHLFISDDDADEVYEVAPGLDGRHGTADDSVTQFDTRIFGSTDPEGLEFDAATGDLFIVDGIGNEIYRVSPGPNAMFDGLDDIVTQFDTTALGTGDPEGLGLDVDRGLLIIGDRSTDSLYEVTRDGVLHRVVSLNFNPGLLSGVALAPGSTNSGAVSWYLTDRAVDNDSDPNENDGKLYEVWVPDEGSVLPVVSVTATDAEATEAPGNTAILTVTRSGVPTGDLVVTYATSGSATDGIDYLGLAGTVVVPDGLDTAIIEITPIDDAEAENFETAIVSILASPAYSVAAVPGNSATAIIADDEITPPVATGVLEVPSVYPTIQLAVDAAQSGDIVLMAPGVYVENIVIAGKAITLASHFFTTGDATFIDATIIDGNAGSEIIDVGPDIPGMNTVVGLTVRNGINGISAFSPLSVLYSHITDTSDAIDFENGSFGSIARANLIDLNKDDAVDFDSTSWGVVEYNLLINNDDDGIEIRIPAGIEANAPSYIIRDNIIAGNGEDGIQMIGNISGVSARPTIIEGNLFENNIAAAFSMMCCSQTVEDFAGASLPERYLINNNTFRNNGHGVIGGDNVIALSNIFVGHDVAVKRLQGDSIAANNLFFNNTVDHLDAITDAPSNLFADPLLAIDSSLLASSPAIDAGLTTFDWLGETVLALQGDDYVGAAPDLGAFEVGGNNPWNQPPFVNAGLPQQLNSGLTTLLAGVVSDDGLPNPSLVVNWVDSGNTGNVAFGTPDALETTVTFAQPGTYVLELQAFDGDLTSSSLMTVSVATTTIDVRVAANSDDAEEASSGGVSLTSSDLELSNDNGTFQTVGMRFANVDVPPGATITGAYVQFQTDETNSVASNLTVRAQAADNPTTFVSASGNITNRPPTTAFVAWSPAAWNSTGEAGPAQQTPDLSTIIQEVVNRPGWAPGNAVALFVSGDGNRTAESFNGVPTAAPLLHIEFSTEPIPNRAPIAADDTATTLIDLPVEINVAANDSDPDNNLDPTTTNTICVGCASPTSGTLVNQLDGRFTYTPNAGYEGPDTFTYEVCDLGGLCDTAVVSVTVDAPPLPVISISATDPTATETPSDTATFTISRTGSTTGPLTVAYTTSGTATEGSDYPTLTGTATIADGQATTTIEILPIDDVDLEITETVIVTVTPDALYEVALSPDNGAIITITDNDSPPLPVVSVTATDTAATETLGDTGTFTISRTGSTTGDMTVSYTSGGSATEGSDYPALTGTATIADGQASTSIEIVPIDDVILEDPETVIVTISSDLAYDVAAAPNNAATITIADNEVPPIDPINVRVAVGSDDAEQRLSGSVALTSSDLELTDDKGNTQTVGLRFTNIAIPTGATVTSAYVQFQADEIGSVATDLTIRGEANDNPVTFSNTTASISNRPTTVASAHWSPPAWATIGEAGAAQRTSDLSFVIQEVVDRSGWASGNAMALIIDGTGKRTAESFNGSVTGAPLLHIEFSLEPVPNRAPVAADDSVSTAVDSPVAINVVANDIDPDRNLDPASANTMCVGCSLPTSGVVANSGGGTFTYTPGVGYLGPDDFIYEVCDTEGLCDTATVSITVTPNTVEVRIGLGSDDAEEKSSGRVALTSSDLELTDDKGNTQTVGLRFTNIAIPAGATITNAYIQFQADEAGSVATNLTIRAQANDNPLTFDNVTGNVTSRPTTVASALWSPPVWTIVGEAGASQRTGDLSAVIQEVIDRAGWNSGNALAVIIDGTGKRTAEAYNGSATGAPLLHVEYTMSG